MLAIAGTGYSLLGILLVILLVLMIVYFAGARSVTHSATLVPTPPDFYGS